MAMDRKTGGALSGALSGAGTGAAIGSAVPGLGTAIGAGAGALLGAAPALFSGEQEEQKPQAQGIQAGGGLEAMKRRLSAISGG